MQISGNIVRNDYVGAKKIDAQKPLEDKVIDLSKGDDSTIAAELDTKDAAFLKVKSGTDDVYLDLSKLTTKEKTALIATLKDKIMTYGAVKNAFNPATFFKLSSSGTLTIGNQTNKQTALKADVMDAQKVMDKSLEKKADGKTYKDEIFVFMNGTTSDVAKEPRPAEWQNGFQVKKNDKGEYDVSTHVAKAGGGVSKPELTLKDYKQMVKKDFNFNGAVSEIQAAAKKEVLAAEGAKASDEGFYSSSYKKTDGTGLLDMKTMHQKLETAARNKFIDSVVQAFDPKHPILSTTELKAVAKEVWSYATTGAATDNSIDIAKLQGMLALLDPEMEKTGFNNDMKADQAIDEAAFDKKSSAEKANYFKVGEHYAPLGDEFHGRSTILQTRHLMESFRPETPAKVNITTLPGELQGYSNTVLLTDVSGSMDDDWGYFAQLLSAGGIDGKLSMAAFYDRTVALQWSDKSGTESTGQVSMGTSDVQKILEKQTDKARTDAFQKKRVDDGSVKETQESGVLGALATLKDKPPKVGSGPNTEQLIIFTDETDAAGKTKAESKAELTKLMDLAKEKGYDIKIIVTSDNKSKDKTFQIVDLAKITTEDLQGDNVVTDLETDDEKKMTSQGGIDWRLLAQKQNATTYQWDKVKLPSQ